MFSKIPQKLTAPFALLGDEAKLAFRSQPGGIHKLTNTPASPHLKSNICAAILTIHSSQNIPETDTYWNQVSEPFDTNNVRPSIN
jgi:hypothetical protein